MRKFFIASILIGVALAGGLAMWQDGRLQSWTLWAREILAGTARSYTPLQFRLDLLDRLNYPRLAAGESVLSLDPKLGLWLDERRETLATSDLNQVTRDVQDALPRYFKVAVSSAYGPSLRGLLQQFHDFTSKKQPEMTHLGCLVREGTGGIGYEAVIVVGQRLNDFTPEALSETDETAFFSVCGHCRHPHIVRVSREKRSMGLECPDCRRTYAVVASDSQGGFRYVNEFLTGYAPPAVFSRTQSRIHELFTIWTAVHANCAYTKDPGVRRDQTDRWQIASETQRLQAGDCEDSSIFLADWLLSRGFQARVALGRYGDVGGHAWVVVRLDDRDYLLESTEGRPDPMNPPLVSKLGSRYLPEILFDRFNIYSPKNPNQKWNGDYWSSKVWSAADPRAWNREVIATGKDGASATAVLSSQREAEARTHSSSTAVAPFLDLGSVPRGAGVWTVHQGVDAPGFSTPPPALPND